MKAKLLLLSVLLTMSSLGFKKGDMVLAPWGSSFYQATIASITGKKAKVNYVDGDKAEVDVAALKSIVNPSKITVGLVVLAKWGAHSYYKAKVLKISGKDVSVQFLDDNSKHTVPKHKIFKY